MFHSQLVAVLSILSAKAQAAESETAQLKSRMVEEEATSYAIIEGKVLALVKVDIGFFPPFSLLPLSCPPSAENSVGLAITCYPLEVGANRQTHEDAIAI